MSGLSWEEINVLVLKARETERERIIKLLESNQVLKETKLKKWLFAQGFRFAIALIKEENK